MGKYSFLRLVKSELRRSLAMIRSAVSGQLDPETAINYVGSNSTFLSGFIAKQIAIGLEDEPRPSPSARKGKKLGTIAPSTVPPAGKR